MDVVNEYVGNVKMEFLSNIQGNPMSNVIQATPVASLFPPQLGGYYCCTTLLYLTHGRQ